MKGLIFDYGGTLDTAGDHWSYIIQEGWKLAGIEVSDELFRDSYVYAERELARVMHILPHHNFGDMLLIKIEIELQHLAQKGLLPPEDIKPKAEIAAKYCNEKAKQSVQHAVPILEELKKKYPMVLVSNFYGNIKSVLKEFGADHLFENIIESAVVGVRKPDPKIFLLGCEALQLQPAEVVVVGDTYKKDILPARSLGCNAVWIKGRTWTKEESEISYTPTISDLSELPDILKQF